jgi:sterol desaturase/sphingolipid hydroxylase (fatty acid hydroxylase superfamily)
VKSLFIDFQRGVDRLHLNWVKEAFLGLFSTRMSKAAFHLDYFVFPPVILACVLAAESKVSALAILPLMLAGFAAWTLAEYLLHRYALHHWPYFTTAHLAHHDKPRAMIAAPTLFTLAFFAATFLLPMWLVFGRGIACASFAGFLLGYLAFAGIHHAVHHSEWQGPMMRYFKRLHAIHHHGDSDKNFGVITDFWDRVFGTSSAGMRRR